MNFYFEAANVLDRLDAKKGSIKGIIASLPEKDRKRTAALVIETLKFKAVLSDAVFFSRLMVEEKKKLTSLNLVLLLVHDLIFSGGIQAGDGPIKQAILRHKTRLKGELEKLKIKKGVKSLSELAQTGDPRAANIPRYVRVNTLHCAVDEVTKMFESRGFTLSDSFELQNPKIFAKDKHVPNLLLFHPNTSFQSEQLYKNGKLILQDKASCFPALVLNPPTNADSCVMDATAAPGNKTSHLSALMQGRGKLYAFEKDKRRFFTLKMMLAKAKCSNTEPINKDFLSVDPEDPIYSKVTHILLDPSCSGSGIVNRLDYLLEPNAEEENDNMEEDRLNKLASFQLMMIKHAMKFPSISRIVYSTCSVHAVENEHVVKQALASSEAQQGEFRLAPPSEVLPQWPRRGIPEEMDDPEHGASLIRCIPGEDATNGFFVSCFVRRPASKRKVDEVDIAISSRKKKKKRNSHKQIQ